MVKTVFGEFRHISTGPLWRTSFTPKWLLRPFFLVRTSSLDACASMAATAPAPSTGNLLICGSDAYKTTYGNSGFAEGEGHGWCDAVVYLSPFECVQIPGKEAYTPAVHMMIGNESAAGCYSVDKRNCVWWVSNFRRVLGLTTS